MNLSMKTLVCAVCAAAVCGGLHAEDGAGGGAGRAWRISVGPTFGGGLRSSLRVAPRTVPVYPAPAGSLSKREAEGKNNAIGASRVEFGDGSFIDPNDSVGEAGVTWNYRLPAGSVREEAHAFEVVNSYVDVTASGRALSFRDTDEAVDYGAHVMFEREVFRKGAFGVDAGGLVSWMTRNDVLRAEGTVGGQTVETGSYRASLGIDPDVNVNSPFFVNPDGSYGYGTEDGPGYRLSLADANIARSWTPGETREVNRMRFSLRGDYQEAELAFLVRPWYELTDWLRVVGTIGAGVSYARFALSTDVAVDGQGAAHRKEAFDAWDVYGVAGLGLMARYSNCCLGFDFLAKLGDDALKVNARDAHGSLERENVTLRVYVGYEF